MQNGRCNRRDKSDVVVITRAASAGLPRFEHVHARFERGETLLGAVERLDALTSAHASQQ